MEGKEGERDNGGGKERKGRGLGEGKYTNFDTPDFTSP